VRVRQGESELGTGLVCSLPSWAVTWGWKEQGLWAKAATEVNLIVRIPRRHILKRRSTEIPTASVIRPFRDKVYGCGGQLKKKGN